MARWNSVRVVGGPTNTTDAATATTIASLDLAATTYSASPDDVAFQVKGILIGRVTATTGAPAVGDCITVEVVRAYKRITGTVTALGGATTVSTGPIGDASLTGIVGTLDNSTTTVRLRANGIVNTTISWTGHLEFFSGEFTG